MNQSAPSSRSRWKQSQFGEPKAFPFVHELGHCLHPSFVSVSHFFEMNVEQYIEEGMAMKATLSQLITMSLDIAKGIELMHSIRGGPYHHTDIRSDQFLIDQHGNVLLNDFNRGKFQQYLFMDKMSNDTLGTKQNGTDSNDSDSVVIRCPFCPHTAHGMVRAPEEHRARNLDETIDIYSGAMVIWSLFSGEEPFMDVDGVSGAAVYLIHDTARRPKMPSNMPHAMKEIITAALSHDPKNRPSAKEMVDVIQTIQRNLSKFSRNKMNITSEMLRERRAFKDVHYPRVSEDFPEFVGESGSD